MPRRKVNFKIGYVALLSSVRYQPMQPPFCLLAEQEWAWRFVFTISWRWYL